MIFQFQMAAQSNQMLAYHNIKLIIQDNIKKSLKVRAYVLLIFVFFQDQTYKIA